MIILAKTVAFAFGFGLVAGTLSSAVQTFVLPRGSFDSVTRTVFQVVRWWFKIGLRFSSNYITRDRLMALYAPVSSLLLLPVWLFLVTLGYTGMFWATGISNLEEAFTISGSSLLTLGFAKGDLLIHTILAFTEATIGLLLVALLIAYLPTMYSAFSSREVAVNLLAVRAGTPPSAVEMLLRFSRIGQLDQIGETWRTWEKWFAELEESHTSLVPLVFFRSPKPEHSWITASGAVLDAAALYLAALDLPPAPEPALCIRAGYLALNRVANIFEIPYNPDPVFPATPISITENAFREAWDLLAAQGLPLKDDPHRAWRDFAGWRVNYDATLISLSQLTMAPFAKWSVNKAEPPTI